MKFSATFAVLAVFVSNAVVSAAPFRGYETDALEARAEFVESALEEVWSRFYDELLEEVEARDFEEDIFEARDFDEEELYVRSPMKKFVGDLASGLAGKAPAIVKQYQQGQDFQNRQKLPTFQQSMEAKKKAEAAKKPAGKKRSFDDDEDLFARSPMKKFVTDLATNMAQKAPSMAQQYTQGQQSQQRQQQPSFIQSMEAKKKAEAAKKAAGKKRSFYLDEDLYERSPMKKFVTDLATNMAQKAPSMAQQYSQGQQSKQRQQQPSFVQAMEAKKKAEAAAKAQGKKRSFLLDEEDIFERSPMKKFVSDLAQNAVQNAPGAAKKVSQGQDFQNRQKLPTFKQSMDAKKKAEEAAKSGKK